MPYAVNPNYMPLTQKFTKILNFLNISQVRESTRPKIGHVRVRRKNKACTKVRVRANFIIPTTAQDKINQ